MHYIISVTRSRDPHVIVIVFMRASPTGSRLARQLLHTGHYAAPPKATKNVTGWKIGDVLLVSFFDTIRTGLEIHGSKWYHVFSLGTGILMW